MATLNPFESAPRLVEEIKNHVTANQNTQIERANAARDRASATVAGLAGSLQGFAPAGVAPVVAPLFPEPNFHSPDIPEIQPLDFGRVTAAGGSAYVPRQVPGAIPVEFVRDFEPAFDDLQIPDAPEAPPDRALPDAPTGREIVRPDRPDLARPDLPNLVELVIPEFAFDPLPAFDDTSPEFVGSSVSTALQWQERPYAPVILDEQMAVLRRMWAGGTGLPPEVEQALWERAASREDVAIARDVSAAAVEFSGRGYTLPPGALVARIDAVRSEGALRKQSLGRDVLVKVADTHIENLRFACTQAIASEGVLIGLWGQMAQRQFDAAKFQIESDLALLNANIAIFNARQASFKTRMDARRLVFEERALQLQAHKAALEGEIAKGQINEQRLKLFLGLYEGVKIDVEVFKAEMQGAQLESELQKNEVEKYKAEIQGVAEKVKVDKLRFEGYESRIKGAVAKGNLLESQARGYAAYVSGKAARADIQVKNVQAQLQVMDLDLRGYIANLERDKARMQSESAAIQALAQAHQANTARFVASTGAETAKSELSIKRYESESRTQIALYEAEIRKHIASMEQLIRVASLQADGLKAVGQMESTLAAGAMAGISLGATVGADARIGASGSSNVNQTISPLAGI